MNYYVSKAGCDSNPGTQEAPFLTLKAAQAAARENPGSVVTVLGGAYRESLELDERDSGSVYRGTDGAALTGGLSLAPSDLHPVSDEVRERLSPEAADHVRAVDLTAYGLTADDWREVFPIGAYQNAALYDDGKIGTNLEIFSGGRRMKLARYPNEGYLKLDAVMDVGECGEFPPQNYWTRNKQLRNPRGGCYIIDRETNERLKGWKEPETAWAFGYFFWDWADSSTPVKVDTVNRALFPKYVSSFGARAGALYYLYNVLEELDAPGEFYLDRKTGMLYVYPAEEGDAIEISVDTKPLIAGTRVDHVVIEGFTLTSVCANGAVLSGNGNVLRGLKVIGAADTGLTVSGYDNVVENCEVTRTGRGGIYVSGGDRNTLTPGNNRVQNNYVHDFSEVYQTYQPGISLGGVGNLCAHNEICGSPHEALTYGGNDHIIEYNYIHDVVTHSNDAGAIYAGFDWCAHGTVIRYNLLENIGSSEFRPQGIYWDDGLSGQSAYGNILIGVGEHAFLVGGGFDNIVRDNVIVGDSSSPISYDDRNRDGFVHDGWARQAVNTPDAPHWKHLRSVPYTSDVWKAKYPTLSLIVTDFSAPDDPNFPVNPSRSVVENNVIIQPEKKLGWLAQSVYTYSKVGENPCYSTAEEADFDVETKQFRHPRPGFPEIHAEKIGRIVK